MVSLSSRYSGSWLTTLPTNPSFILTDPHFNTSTRLGLPPVDNLTASVVPTSMLIHFIFSVVLNSDPQLLPATIVFFNSLLAPHAFLVLLFS